MSCIVSVSAELEICGIKSHALKHDGKYVQNNMAKIPITLTKAIIYLSVHSDYIH